MSESGQRQRVMKALKVLDALPVENPTRPGTPDVNYVEGWIELKWLRRWPVRPESIVKLEHFTRRQRRWLRNRCRAGGNAWLLLQCQREWLIFSGTVAHDHVGNLTREDLYVVAFRSWKRGLKDEELVACLIKGLEN